MRRLWWMAIVVCGVGACSTEDSKGADWELEERERSRASTTVEGGSETCSLVAPEVHRPDASACDNERAPGVTMTSQGEFDGCASDADCTDGLNGRCTEDPQVGYICTYDWCIVDDDCGANGVCDCEGGWANDGNVCNVGNCSTDADCGSNGYCSPSFGDCGPYGGVVGHFCRTCDDECVNDSDCGNAGEYCMYDEGVSRWLCSNAHCDG